MKIKIKKSIFNKIFTSLILILLLAEAFVIYFSLNQQRIRITENLINRSLILAKIASRQTEIAYQNKTLPFEIFKILSSESEDIVFLWLTKPDGEVYFASDPELTTEVIMSKRIKEPFLGTEKTLIQDWTYPQGVEKIKLIVQPLEIRNEEGKPWSLLMGVSLRSVAAAEKVMIFNSIVLFVFTFFLTILIAFYLTKRIINPLKKLREGAAIIGKGNLDYRIEIKTDDEIEKLAEDFNKMTKDLKKSQEIIEEEKAVLEIKINARTKELKELAESLEEKVKRRTKELRGKVAELEDSRRALINILEDVEEARKAIEEEKNKTSAIITNFTDGLLVFDAENKLSLINPQAENILEIKGKEWLGKSTEEMLSASAPRLKLLTDLINKETKKIFRRELGMKEDLIIEVSLMSLLGGAKKIGSLVVLHDISREKEIENIKSEFVSTAAHQLRTPLSAIKWTLQMIIDGDLGYLSPEQKTFLMQGYKSNERMINLVNDLLNVARIEEGRFGYQFSLIQLEDLIQTIIQDFTYKIKEKKINFRYLRPPNPLPKVNVDPAKMRLAIGNLIDNAMKYTPENKQVTISIKYDKLNLEVSVKDDGIGIPINQQKKLFSKFFRSENAVRAQTEGSGLGLFIVKNIIEKHKGQIWFKSAENQGSIFCFTLPVNK